MHFGALFITVDSGFTAKINRPVKICPGFKDLPKVPCSRSTSVSPTESLEPIGPPKRRKMTVTSPSLDSGWPDFTGFKTARYH